jgi:hypothetical protein
MHTGNNQSDKIFGKDEGNNNEQKDNGSEYITDQGKYPPSFRFIFFDKIFREYGNESHGQKTGRTDMIENLRDYKGDLIGIDIACRAAYISQSHFPEKSRDAAEKNRGRGY